MCKVWGVAGRARKCALYRLSTTDRGSMRVVGVDLSLRATGLAAIDDAVGIITVDTDVVKSTTDSGTLTSRHERLEAIAAAVVKYCKDANLVVIESPSYSSGGRGTWDRAGLWWWVISVLIITGATVAEISPKTRAKFVTNNGNAGKNAVGIAIGRLWPDVALRDDNDSDALVLATMGAQHLGMDVPTKTWHAVELAKITWPT